MKSLLLICIIIFFSIQNIKSQIMVENFYFDRNTYTAAPSLQGKLSENLRRAFFILQRDLKDVKKEIDLTRIRDYFRTAINPKFTPATFILTGTVTTSKGYSTLFDLTITITNVEKATKYTINESFLSISDIDAIAENLFLYIRYLIPTYYKISAYVNKKTISINYGSDRSAQRGQELELVSIEKGNVIGEVEVNNVFSESSNCGFDLFENQYDFNENTFREYYVQTKINSKESDYYRKQLSGLKKKDAEEIVTQEVERELKEKQRKGELKDKELRFREKESDPLVFTVQSFTITGDNLKEYFGENVLALSPIVFGLQINFSKADLRVFAKGRYSLGSDYQQNLNGVLTNTKFNFFQAGGGIHTRLDILGFVFPGLSIGVNYMQTTITKEQAPGNTEEIYKGIDVELNGNGLLKFGKLGIYAEIAYHIVPSLKNESGNDLKTSGISIGAGLSFFFD